MSFNLISKHKPAGDQPQAIKALTNGLKNGVDKQVLLGITGSGKTFTMANVIQNTQLPTLIISHNKTLAAQLYQEFKELFPKNKVSYFVSYYDYYQPEAYLPGSDTYIAKEVDINDLIDKLRLETTTNLFSGSDNIVIASVSCIYNIGDPSAFSGRTQDFAVGQVWPRRSLLEALVSLYYTRSELEFKRSTFRVRGPIIEIWPSYQDWIIVLEFDERNRLKSITNRHPFTATEFSLDNFRLFSAKQYVGAQGQDLTAIYKKIKKDTKKQVDFFKSQNRILEAHRIEQRVNYDLEMLEEVGYVNGIENYSIYFEKGRQSGDPPYTLIDYFKHIWGDDFLTIIDESHVTVPQIRGMHSGDLARKQNLINYGFRLPAALDNRPLKWSEFYKKVPKTIYMSATPADFEIRDAKKSISNSPHFFKGGARGGFVVEQIIRPTGLVDPPIQIRPEKNQIPNLIAEIKKRIKLKQRSLLITITKKMSEELSAYLSDIKNTGVPIKVAYLHSDIDTLERNQILEDLRKGKYDCLVGINLLREGLDLPEVSLVAILDAGQQGFLRSRSSLIQIMGRASRHVDGQVILYSDVVSDAMRLAIREVNRRRKKQISHNKKHHITPKTVVKSIRPQLIKVDLNKKKKKAPASTIDPESLTPNQLKKLLTDLKREMRAYATDLNFEAAIEIRNKIEKIEAK